MADKLFEDLKEKIEQAAATGETPARQSDLNRIKRWNQAIGVVVIGIVLGLFIAVYAIIQQYLGTQTATYQSLVDKVTEQNNKIDLLNQKLDFYQEIQRHDGIQQNPALKKS